MTTYPVVLCLSEDEALFLNRILRSDLSTWRDGPISRLQMTGAILNRLVVSARHDGWERLVELDRAELLGHDAYCEATSSEVFPSYGSCQCERRAVADACNITPPESGSNVQRYDGRDDAHDA